LKISHSGNVQENVVDVVVLAVSSSRSDPIQCRKWRRLREMHTYSAPTTPPSRSSEIWWSGRWDRQHDGVVSMVESFRRQGFACLHGGRRTGKRGFKRWAAASQKFGLTQHHGAAVPFIGVQTVVYLQNNFACILIGHVGLCVKFTLVEPPPPERSDLNQIDIPATRQQPEPPRVACPAAHTWPMATRPSERGRAPGRPGRPAPAIAGLEPTDPGRWRSSFFFPLFISFK
jgi:hypothetical protein